MKKTSIKISGNEILTIDDFEVYYCYSDMWKTVNEMLNVQYQGIDTNSATRNVTRLRVGAVMPLDTPISMAFGNVFQIPLDFELLESHIPFR